MKKRTAAFGLLLCLLFSLQSHSQYDQKRSITAISNDQKGVAYATAYLNYAVRYFDKEIWIVVDYNRIEVDPAAGYWHKGKLYKDEVPGLTDLLRTGKCSAPTVKFNIYYNNLRQETRTLFITEQNNLGLLGDVIRLKATEAQLKNPNYRLEAVEMTSFNNVDWWYKAEALIEKYEREKQDESDYRDLIREADAAFYQKNYPEALTKYGTASRHRLADSYPGRQVEKTKEAMQKEKSAGRFGELMQAGNSAENEKDYAEALRRYEAAAQLGVDDNKASFNASRVRRTLDQRKRDEEERLKQEQTERDRKTQAAADKLKKDQMEADRLLKKQNDELKEANEKQLEEEAQKLKDEEQKLLEENRKKQQQEEDAKWERKKTEEKQKEEKEQADRRSADDRLIGRYKNGMKWDPVRFLRLKSKADSLFDSGMQMDPYAALELKNEWWDTNMYMKDFREDLNEPRRRQAWEKCQNLLYKQESRFNLAKYYYMEAVQYTDAGSWQYGYLIGKVKQMNDLMDMQKSSIRLNREGENLRRENFREARAWAVINRQNDNRVRADIAYSHLRQQYLYPTHGDEGPNADKALQRQSNFESRLNAADQQLRSDNLVTGVTSQLVTNAVIDPNKKADPYGNGAMGLNLFLFAGGASYPVVVNTEMNDNYEMSASTDNLAVMPATGGFDWWIRRARRWDLGLTGDLTFGVLPMMGHSNTFLSYGANAKLNVGFKAVKLALEADWHQRSGSFQYDEDVAMQNNQYWQNRELIYTGEFDYTVFRLGGGLHIQYADEYEDGYLRLLLYAEKPSFYQGYNAGKPVQSFAVQWMMKGGFTLNGSYAQNYPVAGTAKYIMRNYTNRDSWSFSVGKIWTVGKTK